VLSAESTVVFFGRLASQRPSGQHKTKRQPPGIMSVDTTNAAARIATPKRKSTAAVGSSVMVSPSVNAHLNPTALLWLESREARKSLSATLRSCPKLQPSILNSTALGLPFRQTLRKATPSSRRPTSASISILPRLDSRVRGVSGFAVHQTGAHGSRTRRRQEASQCNRRTGDRTDQERVTGPIWGGRRGVSNGRRQWE